MLQHHIHKTYLLNFELKPISSTQLHNLMGVTLVKLLHILHKSLFNASHDLGRYLQLSQLILNEQQKILVIKQNHHVTFLQTTLFSFQPLNLFLLTGKPRVQNLNLLLQLQALFILLPHLLPQQLQLSITSI